MALGHSLKNVDKVLYSVWIVHVKNEFVHEGVHIFSKECVQVLVLLKNEHVHQSVFIHGQKNFYEAYQVFGSLHCFSGIETKILKTPPPEALCREDLYYILAKGQIQLPDDNNR